MFYGSLGGGLMYVYYSTVYSTIQDVIEPSLRGTAMALYFFAMYVFGASFGPIVTGTLSERYARGAATTAGIVTFTKDALEPFRAAGLHSAMYLIPVLGGLLARWCSWPHHSLFGKIWTTCNSGCSGWTVISPVSKSNLEMTIDEPGMSRSEGETVDVLTAALTPGSRRNLRGCV